jgi:hypothetical protein
VGDDDRTAAGGDRRRVVDAAVVDDDAACRPAQHLGGEAVDDGADAIALVAGREHEHDRPGGGGDRWAGRGAPQAESHRRAVNRPHLRFGPDPGCPFDQDPDQDEMTGRDDRGTTAALTGDMWRCEVRAAAPTGATHDRFASRAWVSARPCAREEPVSTRTAIPAVVVGRGRPDGARREPRRCQEVPPAPPGIVAVGRP